MTSEDNAWAIVHSVVTEMLGQILQPVIINALTNRIIACLAEVELLPAD